MPKYRSFYIWSFQIAIVLEKSNTKVIEISSTLVIKNHKIFSISKDAIKNLSTQNLSTL